MYKTTAYNNLIKHREKREKENRKEKEKSKPKSRQTGTPTWTKVKHFVFASSSFFSLYEPKKLLLILISNFPLNPENMWCLFKMSLEELQQVLTEMSSSGFRNFWYLNVLFAKVGKPMKHIYI